MEPLIDQDPVAGTRARVGDVFRIPLAGDLAGFGQVVAIVPPNPLYVAVFEPAFSANQTADLRTIIRSRPLLLANCLDAKLWNGDWPVVANLPVSLDLPFPVFREHMGEASARVVVSYDGKQRRKATDAEWDKLSPRYGVSPAVVERAFRAHHGFAQWEERFDKLRYDTVTSWAEVEV